MNFEKWREQEDANIDTYNYPDEAMKMAWEAAKKLGGCKWKEDKVEGYFHTECGYDYALMDGTLEDNEHNYCPKCGGLIIEI